MGDSFKINSIRKINNDGRKIKTLDQPLSIWMQCFSQTIPDDKQFTLINVFTDYDSEATPVTIDNALINTNYIFQVVLSGGNVGTINGVSSTASSCLTPNCSGRFIYWGLNPIKLNANFGLYPLTINPDTTIISWNTGVFVNDKLVITNIDGSGTQNLFMLESGDYFDLRFQNSSDSPLTITAIITYTIV